VPGRASRGKAAESGTTAPTALTRTAAHTTNVSVTFWRLVAREAPTVVRSQAPPNAQYALIAAHAKAATKAARAPNLRSAPEGPAGPRADQAPGSCKFLWPAQACTREGKAIDLGTVSFEQHSLVTYDLFSRSSSCRRGRTHAASPSMASSASGANPAAIWKLCC
jgi:hypothetical protein